MKLTKETLKKSKERLEDVIKGITAKLVIEKAHRVEEEILQEVIITAKIANLKKKKN